MYTQWNAKDVFKELIWRIEEHRVGTDQMNEQEDFSNDLDGTITENTYDTAVIVCQFSCNRL